MRFGVSRLPKDPGPAGWNAVLPAPGPASVLEGAVVADWLVIGAGFAGLSAARRLSQLCPEDRIVALDARRVADGPAGRNSGFMIDLPHDLSSDSYSGALEADRVQTEDNRFAIDVVAEMANEYGLPEEAFVRSGKINAAATLQGEDHNADYTRHLTAMSEPFEVLGAAEMHEITGSHYYRSGVFTPGAAMVQPAMFVRGVAEGLRSNRVSLYENSPVLALERVGSDWCAVTSGGRVTAPKVILAVNGHLESFGQMQGRLMHVFTYASMTRALTPDEVARVGGRSSWGVLPADPMGTTVRRVSGAGGDRVVVRSRFTFEPGLEISDRQLARATADHDRLFAARFPALAGVPMEHVWGGRLCLSRNGVQVIGELEDGLWSACCQNGLGTVKGTYAGLMAAEAATGVTSDRVQRALGSDAPSRLPPKPIAKLGASARLAWGRRRAGREV